MEILQSSKSKFDLYLWPIDPKINRGTSWVMINSCVKYHYCMSKGNRVIVLKGYKVQSPNLTFGLLIPKSIEVIGSWSTNVWSIIIVCQKVMELSCGNDENFKVQIWPWPFHPKINRGLPPVIGNTCVKYHHCRSKRHGVIMLKPLFHRRTDRQMDRQRDKKLSQGWDVNI